MHITQKLAASRTCLFLFGLVLVQLIGSVTPVQAQPGGRGGGGRGGFDFGSMMGGGQGGMARVLGWEGLADELKLSDEQKTKLKDITAAATPDREVMMGYMMRMREASEDERTEIREEIQGEVQARVTKINDELKQTFTPDQFKRFEQLGRQQSGVRVLTDDDTIKDLQLSDDQQAKIQELIAKADEGRREMFRMPREEREKRQAELNQSVLAVLSPQQQQTWEKMLGPAAPELTDTTSLRPSLANGAKTESETKPEAVADASDSAASEMKAEPDATDPLDELMDAVDTVSNDPVASGPSIVDFGTADLANSTVSADGAQLVSFNFQNAAWGDVLKLFARIAGLTLDMKDTPPGTFTYYDKQQQTATSALDVLNGYLLPRGFLIVRRDQFLIVTKISEGIPPNLVPMIESSSLPERGKNELVKTVFELDGLQAKELVDDVKNLLGPQGSVTAMGATNRLAVTGLAQNLIRVEQLLNGSGPTAGPNDVAFRAFPLKYIPARDAEPTIKALLGGGTGFDSSGSASSGRSSDPRAMFMQMIASRFSGGRSRGSSSKSSSSDSDSSAMSARVTVDERTNSLLVAALPAELLIVEKAVEQIDLPASDAQNQFAELAGPQLKVYPIPDGDLGKISETIMSLVPGVLINSDDRADVLHVIADDAKQREVAALIGMLDGTGGTREVTIIPLLGLDPNWAAITLDNMFLNEGENAPIIQTDQYGRNLVVRGTSDSVLQVKALVLQMSQTMGRSQSIPGLTSGNIRQIPLQGQDPEQLLPVLQKLWQSSNRSSLRIVRPGQEIDERTQNKEQPSESTPRDTQSDETSGDQQDDRVSTRPEPRLPSTLAVPVVFQETGDDSTPTAESGDPSAAASEPQNDRDSPGDVVITLLGDRLIITGQDEQQLNELQNLLDSVMNQFANQTQWTIFYLRAAEAEATAATLRQLFPDVEVASSTSTSSSLPLISSGTTSAPRIRIVPESRSNALFVTGPANRIAELEDVIKLLDNTELPETFRQRTTHTIPVLYASATDVAQILSEVYADLLPQQIPTRGRGGEEQGGESLTAGELTIGVDTQTSQIIVSCRESLFQQIEELVTSLDDAARAAKRTVKVVNLEYADAASVQATLGTLLPKVKFSASSGARVSSSGGNSNSDNGSSNNNSGSSRNNRPSGNDAGSSDSRRQFFEEMMRRRMQEGGGGGRGGGGRPSGGRGGR